jgi:hypothetical protein
METKNNTSPESEPPLLRRQLLIPVRDKAAFRDLIQRTVDKEKGFGTKSAAAEELSVPRPQLVHWSQGRRITRVFLVTYEALQRWVEQQCGDTDRLLFSRAFPRPATHEVMLGYTSWMEQTLEALLGLTGSVCWGVNQEGIPTALTGEVARAGLLTEYKALRAKLEADHQALVDFQTKIRQRGISLERIELAVARILAPLLDHSMSAFVEPAVEELDPDELKQFIKAGIDREEIILDARTDDIPRFNAVAALKLLERQPRRERAVKAYKAREKKK